MRGQALAYALDRRLDARVCRRQEARLRDDERARVERLAADALRERADLFAVPFGENQLAYRVALLLPRGDLLARARPPGEPDGAVERDPAEQFRVEEVSAASAHLPDAVVRLAPALDRARGHELYVVPPGVGYVAARALVVEVHGVEHLAVDVELRLVVRGVARPHGARAAVAFEVFEPALGGEGPAVERVDGLQAVAARDAEAVEPVEEVRGLVVVAEKHQRVEDERRVAQPRVAVVPVAHAADLFGQRRGRRGDERARRLVRQKLQGERAAAHVLGVTTFVAARVPPLLPVTQRLLKLAVCLGARRSDSLAFNFGEIIYRDPDALALSHSEATDERARVVAAQTGRARER